MSGSYSGLVATKLLLLSELHKFHPGDKVRFLGCVTSYSTQSAVLTLEHNHPQGNNLKAFVNVEHVLNTLKSTETQIGEWVNVMGYVTPKPRDDLPAISKKSRNGIYVQAIVLWSAGPIKLDKYEQSLDQQNL
ncbi:CST complex subunit Ten1 [Xylogone sp. PMI_703]|nr:CST complex subunit Ten1 [Xylogone sp. PMI_703]